MIVHDHKVNLHKAGKICERAVHIGSVVLYAPCAVALVAWTFVFAAFVTARTFFDANISLAQPNPPFKLYYPNWSIYTRTRSLPPSRIMQSEIRDSLLGDGSDIVGARIVDSVIGVRSNVMEGTRLKEVVMMGADYFETEDSRISLEFPKEQLPPLGIGKNCSIERAIIAKDARIGDGVVIRSQPENRQVEEDNYWIKDGITIIPKGAVLLPGTEI